MFYHFSQNNSGGSFDMNNNVHINVIIEAHDANHANDRAEHIGIYFNGVNDGLDCDCCGDRWSRQWDDERGCEVPSIYGEPIANYEANDTWSKDKIKGYIYYLDGRKEVIK